MPVSAPVMRLGVAASGAIRVPPLGNHDLAGWYDRSVTPGQRGSSLILGLSSTGTSVFFSIKALRPGNMISVLRANGSTAVFTVDGVQKIPKSVFPASEVYGTSAFPASAWSPAAGPSTPRPASTRTTSWSTPT